MKEVEVDHRGNVYVVGDTSSPDIPGPDPSYPCRHKWRRIRRFRSTLLP